MEIEKVKLYNISNFDEYILLSLEKTENSIELIEDFLSDINLGDSFENKKECLKLIDKKSSFVGVTSAEVIWGKEKIFFITNIQDKECKKILMKRIRSRTEFTSKK